MNRKFSLIALIGMLVPMLLVTGCKSGSKGTPTLIEDVGMDMLSYATMLMPLSTYNQRKDLATQKKVWNFCVESNLKFTPRFQLWVWGKKRSI